MIRINYFDISFVIKERKKEPELIIIPVHHRQSQKKEYSSIIILNISIINLIAMKIF